MGKLLIYLLMPAVFVLTKIGEGTVKSLLFIYRIVVVPFSKLSYFLVTIGWVVTKPIFALSQIKRERRKSYGVVHPTIIIYAIPFQFKLRYVFLGIFITTLFFVPFIIRILFS
jgi:hypothetical protein